MARAWQDGCMCSPAPRAALWDPLMDIHARLVEVLDQARSPSGALDAAARVIAESLGAEECMIFVQRKRDGLEPRARFGPAPEQSREDEAKALAQQTLSEVLPRTNEPNTPAMVAVPVAALNHAIGAIVARRATGIPFATEEIMRLSGVAAQMVGLIESARLIEVIGEHQAGAGRADAAVDSRTSTGQRILRGVVASPGIAIGAATFRNAFPRALVHRDTTYRGELEECARARDARQKTQNDLVRLQAAAASEIGEEQALIFGAHLLMLSDSMLTNLIDLGIASGRPASVAVDEAFDEIVRRVRLASDPYLQERVEDVEDLRSRILGHVLGIEHQGSVDARVVISNRTTPSLVVELKARGALGLASELGGPTSHSALLARALGVPAVSGIEGVAEHIAAGDLVIIDGDEGVVVVRPTAEARAEYEQRARVAEHRQTEFLRYCDQPARTSSNHGQLALLVLWNRSSKRPARSPCVDCTLLSPWKARRYSAMPRSAKAQARGLVNRSISSSARRKRLPARLSFPGYLQRPTTAPSAQLARPWLSSEPTPWFQARA